MMTKIEVANKIKEFNLKLESYKDGVKKIKNYTKDSECVNFINRVFALIEKNNREMKSFLNADDVSFRNYNFDYYFKSMKETVESFEIGYNYLKSRPPIVVKYDPNKKPFTGPKKVKSKAKKSSIESLSENAPEMGE